MAKKELSHMATGRFIREKRTELNLTQDELALKLGITKNAISNWENANALVDVKYLVPLSNIFSVEIDDILFPKFYLRKENTYSDISVQFQKTTHFELMDPQLCKKLLDMFVDCKILLTNLINQYRSTRDEKLISLILRENKFGFSFLDECTLLDRALLENVFDADFCVEDQLETLFYPFLSVNQAYDKERNKKGAYVSHIFLGKRYDPKDETTKEPTYMLSSNTAMAIFIFDFGGERIFRKFISTFSQEYRNAMLYGLYNFLKKNGITENFTNQERKAMKYLLRAGAEFWVDGENLTSNLMLKIFK